MSETFRVEGTEEMPVHLVSVEEPREFSMQHLVSGVPLLTSLARLAPGEGLHLADHATRPGRTRSTSLA